MRRTHQSLKKWHEFELVPMLKFILIQICIGSKVMLPAEKFKVAKLPKISKWIASSFHLQWHWKAGIISQLTVNDVKMPFRDLEGVFRWLSQLLYKAKKKMTNCPNFTFTDPTISFWSIPRGIWLTSSRNPKTPRSRVCGKGTSSRIFTAGRRSMINSLTLQWVKVIFKNTKLDFFFWILKKNHVTNLQSISLTGCTS